MIVLDASSVVELVLGTPVLGHRAAREIVSAGGVLHGPHLVDAEVGQTLRRFVLRGIISSGRASMALSRLRTLAMVRHPHVPLLSRAFDLRANASFYDALSLALAETLGAPLLTVDAALANIPGHGAQVILLGR